MLGLIRRRSGNGQFRGERLSLIERIDKPFWHPPPLTFLFFVVRQGFDFALRRH